MEVHKIKEPTKSQKEHNDVLPKELGNTVNPNFHDSEVLSLLGFESLEERM